MLAKNSAQISQRLVNKAGVRNNGPVRPNFYSFRHTAIDMRDPPVQNLSLSMFAGHKPLFADPRERYRMFEAMGSRTTELYKTLKLAPLEPIRRAMDATIWPAIQAATKTDLRPSEHLADAGLMRERYRGR